MSIGAIVYKVRSRFRHGIRVAHARDILRPKILATAPVSETHDATAEIHVMTSQADWLNLIWALKSFYHYSRRHYRLCVHEDGSVTPEALGHLRRHFPAARIIARNEADSRVFADLAAFPNCLHFRKTNILSPKVFDFVTYLDARRLLLLDSDLLFFAEPTALLQRMEDPNFRMNAFNSDCGFGYTVTPEIVREHFDFELLPRVNSGLGVIHRESMRWDWVEQFLELPGLLQGHFWRIEQTLIALCACRFGVELLPSEYTVYLDAGIGARPFRHYVGQIRHLMYVEGIKHLIRDGFLEELRP